MSQEETNKKYTGLRVLGAIILFFSQAGLATATVERLIMPGPVIEGHVKYENDCKSCHEPFKKSSQRRLCLDCHKKVAEDVSKKIGYHGLSKGVGETECNHCHTEHKGREANVVLLGKEVFDHRSTDFPLKGGHVKVTCAACHEPKKKHREAPSKCIDCHKKHDLHGGRLGEACADCHEEKSWRTTRYDHNKTKFPLKGKHEKVACNSCHPSERWKKTPMDCFSCHRLNDAHGARYGKKCETCHTPGPSTTASVSRPGSKKPTSNWNDSIYNHDKTEFPLKGKHQKVACDPCHPGILAQEKLDTACFPCHKNDDQHKGRYGKKCQSCHTPKEWKHSIYDHDKTKFPLKDKHRKVACDACHRGPSEEKKLPMDCHNCHQADDVHKGQEGKQCERCHNQRGWRVEVFFDHDLTRFPLIGLHAVTPCEECHLEATYKQTPSDCLSCHKPHDDHKGSLGPKCAPCHNPNGWDLWTFDHDSGTDFKLEGAHQGLQCRACHMKPVKAKIRQSMACSSCHQKDDVHRGTFGQPCQRCHTTKSFKEVEIVDGSGVRWKPVPKRGHESSP